MDARFHDTYRIAGFVREVLESPFSGHLSFTSEFFVDDEWVEAFVAPYPRRSALHHFAEYAVRHVYHAENIGDIDLDYRKRLWTNFSGSPGALAEICPHVLPIEYAFRAYGLQEESFADALTTRGRGFGDSTADDIFDHYQELTLGQSFDDLVRRVADEVFHVLFNDRQALLLFASLVAQRVVSDVVPEDLDPAAARFIECCGRLRRVRPPQWVRRAVYHRDRGRCVLCRRDLSGMVSLDPDNTGHLDHIVPLAQGGQNDVANFQFLCPECNLSKGDRVVTTSSIYESWLPAEDDS